MKTSKSDEKKVKSFNPDSALKRMSEVLIQIQDLTSANNEEADNQKRELSKEIYRLGRSIKDFYKKKPLKIRKKKKESR